MSITYRPATADDLVPATKIVQQAFSDLRQRHAVNLPTNLSPPLFQTFCLTENPEGLWVAEYDGAVVGLGLSWICGAFWYLSQLFIRPDLQASGVGQGLMARTLELAAHHGATNRALITLGYNMKSAGLYLRNGLFPREPLFRLAAPAPSVRSRLSMSDCATVPIAQPEDWVGRLDEAVLGFRRQPHHRFLQGSGTVRAAQIEHAGRPVGYAYVAPTGHIGPLAIEPGTDARPVILAAIGSALESNPAQLSINVPGKAERALQTLLELGFRLEEPMVLMSAKPFGDWQHYLPRDPGYL
ncbi:GNAT family N-acetyltransferase [Belnapia sp. T18]|uniref:GNAT family N-acetyltransferase n=1 Tax=Belnapia arida TaxID=2804533 RepID=A0ABS1U9J4_9PROT|nr:GNAT family N-acetyltransferase [Belnapia arida]MBL6081358.1 GNAT family N-acetyltransferase [Belnapia arida]